MARKIVSVDGATYALPAPVLDKVKTDLTATFVTFKNSDGTPVSGSNVVITLSADGTDIQDITVEAL